MKQIVVLGGGASGIAAAIAAAEQAKGRAKVLLLEQNQRIGKKLLATGNGRCNLDHVPVIMEDYVSSDPTVLRQMLSAIAENDPLIWFNAHGLLTRTDAEGRVYPYSNQASDLLNLLLYWLQQTNVTVKTECKVKSLVQKSRDYQIVTEDGERISAQAVICAFGGKAGPQFGTDGFGGRFSAACGLAVQKEYPCLVPLRCAKSQIAGLSGIRVKAEASLYDGMRLIRKENGEIQFTETGLSGIAVMQLSNRMKERKPYQIRLNLFPQLSSSQLTDMLYGRKRQFTDAKLADIFTGLLNRRIGMAVLKSAGLKADRPISELTDSEMKTLSYTLSDWKFDELAPTEWKQAQTTGGGVRLSQLEPDSFMLKGYPGLYLVGETLDCAGNCGGYNLHFAFGSGIVAGTHAGKQRI